MTSFKRARQRLVVALTVGIAGCSGGGSSTPAPAPTDIPASGVTITISSTGISPSSVSVTQGGRVTFVNNDSQEHQMYSDPHPEHTSCPEFDQVGFLSPGQSRTTGNLNTSRTCNFHDHEHFENTSLRGSVIIR